MNKYKIIIQSLLLISLMTLSSYAISDSSDKSHEEERPATTETINGRYLLVDVQIGKTVSNQDFRGRYQLITFGYTYCPDVCPMTLTNLAEILKQLGNDADKIQPFFITVDPERDTAEVLSRYTEFFDKRIHGLTGSPESIRRSAENFNVRYAKVRSPDDPPDQYAVDHSAGIYLLGPDAQFITKFGYGLSATEIAQRLSKIINPE